MLKITPNIARTHAGLTQSEVAKRLGICRDRLDKLMGFESAEQEQPKIELALFDLFELSPGA